MARLRDFEKAVLDIRKLEDYCLDPTHPRGRHKARVFRDVGGIGRGDAGWLRRRILEALRTAEAVKLTEDEFGVRWRVDVRLTRLAREIVIRTVWIVRTGEEAPRFVTCWIE